MLERKLARNWLLSAPTGHYFFWSGVEGSYAGDIILQLNGNYELRTYPEAYGICIMDYYNPRFVFYLSRLQGHIIQDTY